jgi:hypothetical protein
MPPGIRACQSRSPAAEQYFDLRYRDEQFEFGVSPPSGSNFFVDPY